MVNLWIFHIEKKNLLYSRRIFILQEEAGSTYAAICCTREIGKHFPETSRHMARGHRGTDLSLEKKKYTSAQCRGIFDRRNRQGGVKRENESSILFKS